VGHLLRRQRLGLELIELLLRDRAGVEELLGLFDPSAAPPPVPWTDRKRSSNCACAAAASRTRRSVISLPSAIRSMSTPRNAPRSRRSTAVSFRVL